MKRNIFTAVLAVITCGSLCYGLIQRREVERQRSISEQMAIEAVRAREEAEMQMRRALEARAAAEEFRRLAEQQRLLAEKSARLAREKANNAGRASSN